VGLIQYFIEKGSCHSERETRQKTLLGGAYLVEIVVDSAEPNSKKILLRMSQYFVDANSLISVYILISAYSLISVYILLNYSSFLLIISQFIIILLHINE
jgi:hypothetical protein